MISFFFPDAILVKSDWTWNDREKVIYNTLSKDLEELNETDWDYNLVVNFLKDENGKVVETTYRTIPHVEIIAKNLNRLIMGQNEN